MHVILGAGLSGLLLARALRREGLKEDIVLLDRRTTWGQDRTWCFWGPTAWPVSARWDEWEVAGVRHRSRRYPYVHLDSRDFYARALDGLDVRPGVSVLGVEDRGDEVEVFTDSGPLRAARVYDALGASSPLLRGRPAGEVEISQHFLGQVVETERPRFDPRRATLMDFAVSQEDGLRFMYVLPFGATRALVEDTYIGRRPVPPARKRERVAEWLGVPFGVEHEERGRIPMTTHSFVVGRSPRVLAVGAAGGTVRPSSGYAFVRTERHGAALARAVVRGERPPERVGAARWDWLDRVFLRALEAEPEAFPERFGRLADGMGPDAFARFMSDRSTPVDEARAVAALPKLPFTRAALPFVHVLNAHREERRRVARAAHP